MVFGIGEIHRRRKQQAIFEIRKSCRARSNLVQRHQFLRPRIIQRLQQHAIRNAEDSRVRPDPQRERQYGHGCEAR